MSEKSSVPERVHAAFLELSVVATGLNSASDELSKTVAELDAALQQLNLGISAWVVISDNSDENGNYWSRALGYAKVGNEWGVALKDITGHQSWDEDQVEMWRFNDAPRWMRIESIGKIPELLERLTKQANGTTEQIKKKTAEAKEITTAIKAAAAESKTSEHLAAFVKAVKSPSQARK